MKQESQVLLTLTNPVENITHVSLYTCDEADPDDIYSTAKVIRFSQGLLTCFFTLLRHLLKKEFIEIHKHHETYIKETLYI